MFYECIFKYPSVIRASHDAWEYTASRRSFRKESRSGVEASMCRFGVSPIILSCIISQQRRHHVETAAALCFYKTGRRKLVIHVLSMWGEEPSHYFLPTVLQGGEANCPAVV